MLVVDASLLVEWCTAPGEDQFGTFVADDLCAPPLMWSEARSALHELSWRGHLNVDQTAEARVRLTNADVEEKRHPGLADEAWRIADDLGWAKTYDAEYVALASLLGCRLVTVDARLRRGADRLGFVIAPTEL